LNYEFPILTTGRRKCAVAQVKIISGVGNIFINNKIDVNYLQQILSYKRLLENPYKAVEDQNSFDFKTIDIVVNVAGGGLSGQSQAIQLGIARGFCQLNPSYRFFLKKNGLLTTDARCKERKKYGLKKARKASQFSKR
jgi:small subunit ribosomal protein S9